MKTFAFDTTLAPRALNAKRIHWIEDGKPQSKILLVSTPAPLDALLVEHDDGTEESEIRDAIAAAALADDWTLAFELVTRYGLSACLRCGVDVAQRPTWRAHRLGIKNNWGEICGSCAAVMIAERT